MTSISVLGRSANIPFEVMTGEPIPGIRHSYFDKPFDKGSLMTSSEPTKKPSGRPRSYDQKQLGEAIDHVRNAGHQPTPEAVSRALTELFGVSGTIRLETLAREIQALLEEETRTREDTLLRALPNDVTMRIDARFADAKRGAALIVAEELERLSKAQHERDLSASRERAMLVSKNSDLEAELDETRAEMAKMAEALGKADAEKSDLANRLRDLEQEFEKLRAAGDARSETIADFERLLFENGWTRSQVPPALE